MAYGKIKADTIVYDDSGSDVEKTVASLAAAAPTASPTFTGTPAAPTAADGTNNTQIATTAFVHSGYATKLSPTFSGTPAAPTASAGTNNTQIATTAYVDVSFAPKASPTFSGTVTTAGITIDGAIEQVAEAVGALEIDCSAGNYFTKTISGNSTFTFANPAASGTVTSFTLELTHSSGTVTWPSSVKWNADTAPTLTAGKTHLFMFVTDDGGTRYRGAALVDYVN